MFVFQLIADNRIESAAEGSVCQVVVEAGEAAAAAGDVVFVAGKCFFREVGVTAVSYTHL